MVHIFKTPNTKHNESYPIKYNETSDNNKNDACNNNNNDNMLMKLI